MAPGRQSGISEPGPIRPFFRVFAGAIALGMIIALVSIAAQIPYSASGARPGDWIWTFLLAVTLAFAARYFGFFAITGHPPTRAPRTPLRTVLDAAYGITATCVILSFISALGGPLLVFMLIFLKAMHRYWEHGAASVRPRSEEPG